MFLLDAVLPRRCVVCRFVGDLLCEGCAQALERIRPPLCERCGAPTAWPVRRCAECTGRRIAFAAARAAVVYDARAKALVSAWKEHGLRRLAAQAADVTREALERPGVALVTFVPSDSERARERGHHPAEALARALAERWALPVAPLLRRTRPLERQAGLSRRERRRNVRGAFVASAAVPRTVCLVDDVYTSGATASAAASALRAAGARRVEVVTFARAARVRW